MAAPGTDNPELAAMKPRFVAGSTMRHVMVMTFTGAVGLMAMFLVDLADLWFLSLLGDPAITAAIGFAGTLVFINISFAIGAGIAAAALVARHVGSRDNAAARRYATNSLVFSICLATLVAAAMGLSATPLLRLLGAEGEALRLARLYIWTVLPGFPLIAGAVACSFSLRAVADPRRAMYVTLVTAVVNGILDPIFIFGFQLSIQGAALATVFAEAAALAVGLHGIAKVHRFLAPFRLADFRRDLKPILDIAVAAILTQLATPLSMAYLTRIMAAFGDEAVTATAIINRITPVAFGIVFSLSGAVGPIIGQNYGARHFDRVRRALLDAVIFAGLYTVATSLVLLALRNHIPALFNAPPETAVLVAFYCTWLAASWCFTGAQFVAQAAFNNLGKPHWSTAFNWGRATVGTIPFVHAGAAFGGATGVLIGSAGGSVLFGLAAVAAAFHLVARIARTKN